MSIEAMKQALEALKANDELINGTKTHGGLVFAMDGYYSVCFDIDGTNKQTEQAITALRQAIEQAEKQEGWVLREVYFSEGEPIGHREPQPVAWANKKGQFKVHKEANEIFKSTAIPFYAAPVHARPVVHAVQCTYPQCQATNGCVGACSKTAPEHASDISQERVDETEKDRHEPVAWLDGGLGVFYWACEFNDRPVPPGFEPLYAAYPRYWSNVTDDALIEEVRRRGFTIRDAQISPNREWVGLTDHELQVLDFNDPERGKLARAVEAKLKEKNNG